MKKNLKQFLMALCLLVAPLGIEAQSLVFHLAGGNLPAAGYRSGGESLSVESYGYYLSSTPNGNSNAFGLYFKSDRAYSGNSSRVDEQSVRPVR